jgi:hypothetical protein
MYTLHTSPGTDEVAYTHDYLGYTRTIRICDRMWGGSLIVACVQTKAGERAVGAEARYLLACERHDPLILLRAPPVIRPPLQNLRSCGR